MGRFYVLKTGCSRIVLRREMGGGVRPVFCEYLIPVILIKNYDDNDKCVKACEKKEGVVHLRVSINLREW